LHAHDIVPWADGGPTDLDNLVSLCGFHHRLVHEGGWSIALEGATVIWSDAVGFPVGVEPLSGSAGDLVDDQRQLGIGPRTGEARAHGDRIDYGFAVSVVDHMRRLRQCRPTENVPAGTLSRGRPSASMR
jgi:hypothetical protein